MQPSMPFDWGRVVTPLRWVARMLGGVLAFIVAFLVLLFIATPQGSGSIPKIDEPVWNAALGSALGVGLLLAIFWTGLGEVIGGLMVIGASVGFLVMYVVSGAGPIVVIIPAAIVSLLFIICGWYTLAQRSRHATPTPA